MSIDVIGKDVWWDTELQEFRKKRFNLTKVPLKFRCPSCGKIVVKPRDREPLLIRDKQDRKIKGAEIKRLFELEKPPKSEWNEFVERHEELFEVQTIEIPQNPAWWLGFYGGVCRECWLDGFGRYGDYGGFMGRKTRDRKEKGKLAYQKREQEEIAKYGKEPKSWVDFRWIENPEWRAWYTRKLEIDRDDKRMKDAKFVKSHVLESKYDECKSKVSDPPSEEQEGKGEVEQ